METEGFLPRSKQPWSLSYFYQLDPGSHISLFDTHAKWGSEPLVILTKEQVRMLARMFRDEDHYRH